MREIDRERDWGRPATFHTIVSKAAVERLNAFGRGAGYAIYNLHRLCYL